MSWWMRYRIIQTTTPRLPVSNFLQFNLKKSLSPACSQRHTDAPQPTREVAKDVAYPEASAVRTSTEHATQRFGRSLRAEVCLRDIRNSE